MKRLTSEQAKWKTDAWDLIHRLDAVGSQDADIVRGLLDQLSIYQKLLLTEQNQEIRQYV